MPKCIWEDLALDFIVGLPTSQGNTTILVVIDHLTKYAHFGALLTHYIASKVAELFTHMVIRLHGVPCTLVSDRDPVFTSQIWKKLFEFMGTYETEDELFLPFLNRRLIRSDKPILRTIPQSFHNKEPEKMESLS